MDGLGTDEKSIINVLCSCNSSQRNALKKAFKSKLNEDLLQVVRQELSGKFLQLSLIMLRDPLAFSIDLINTFCQDKKRWPILAAFLMHKSSKEISDIKEKYESRKKIKIRYILNLILIKLFFQCFKRLYEKKYLDRCRKASV